MDGSVGFRLALACVVCMCVRVVFWNVPCYRRGPLSKAGTSRRTIEQSGVAGEVHGLAGSRTGPSVNPRKQPVLYPTKCKLSLYAKQRWQKHERVGGKTRTRKIKILLMLLLFSSVEKLQPHPAPQPPFIKCVTTRAPLNVRERVR